MDPAQGEALCHFYVDLLYIQLLPCCYIESCQRYDTLVLEGSGRSIWPPGHIITPQGAGVRNTPWILAAVKSFTILHMPTPCVFSVSYHTIPFCHLQPYFWISFKLSKSITEAQMQRGNFLFHTIALKYVEPGTNIFLMALEREIRLSLKPPPLNGLFWLIDQDPLHLNVEDQIAVPTPPTCSTWIL